MKNKEQVIQEQRLIEATKKNLMGASGKLAIIAKYAGVPIISQSMGIQHYEGTYSPGMDSTPLDDYEDNNDELDTFYGEENVLCLGYTFDGLSRGMHLEIQYFYERKTIKVNFKGYQVYFEDEGVLLGYAPFPEWETLIDKMYKIAERNKEKIVKSALEIDREELKKEKIGFLERLRMVWGI